MFAAHFLVPKGASAFRLAFRISLNRLNQPLGFMPNQLARSKKRKTVAEHAAVLAMLEQIAVREGTTSTELMREAVREIIRRHAQKNTSSEDLREVLNTYAPKPPVRVRSAKELSRFKIESREFDELTMDLGLSDVVEIQNRNSIHSASKRPVLIGQL